MISFLEFTEVLKYEADVMRYTKLSVYERWAKYKVGDKVHILMDNRSAVIQRINHDEYETQKYLIGYKDDDGDYVRYTMEEFNLTK